MKLAGDICRVAPKSSRCYAAYSGDVAPALLVRLVRRLWDEGI